MGIHRRLHVRPGHKEKGGHVRNRFPCTTTSARPSAALLLTDTPPDTLFRQQKPRSSFAFRQRPDRIVVPPTGYRLSRFVDSINNKRSRYAGANFLPVSCGKLDSTPIRRPPRFIISLERRNCRRYRCTKIFEFQRGIVAIEYSICEEMDPPAFCTRSHFSRAFLTGTLLHTYVKAQPRVHPRETCLSLTFYESWRISFIC